MIPMTSRPSSVRFLLQSSMLIRKAKYREESGWLPLHENAEVWATAPSGSDYPPLLAGSVAESAAHMLYYYFEGRNVPTDDRETQERELQPYRERVLDAWRQGRNMRSIRLLAVLADELLSNVSYYLPGADSGLNLQHARGAAQYLGIEDDWPGLLPARLPTHPRYSPYASNPNFAANCFSAAAGVQHGGVWGWLCPGKPARSPVRRDVPALIGAERG